MTDVSEVDIKVQVTMRVRDDVDSFAALQEVLMGSESAGASAGLKVLSVRPVIEPKEEGEGDNDV